MYRILIADDELIERKMLYKILARELGDQCQIWQAGNGREALALFEEHDVQIAVLDIEMPGMSGILAAQEMRQRKEDCCIIFLTAYDDFSYAKRAISLRVLDYLLKPCREEELISVVEEAVRLTDKAEKERAYREERAGLSEERLTAVGSSVEDSSPAASSVVGSLAGERPAAAGISGEGQPRLQKVAEIIRSYIEENYVRDLSMQDVAGVINYSEAYFCKLFKQCFDKNFTVYLTECRVEAAKKLLEQPTVNVKDIGEAVGYGDSNYFAKVFKRVTGVSPTEYRMGMGGKR